MRTTTRTKMTAQVFLLSATMAAPVLTACSPPAATDGAPEEAVSQEKQAIAAEINGVMTSNHPLRFTISRQAADNLLVARHKLAKGTLQFEVALQDKATVANLLGGGPAEIEINPSEFSKVFVMTNDGAKDVPLASLADKMLDPASRAMCGKRMATAQGAVATSQGKLAAMVGLGWLPEGQELVPYEDDKTTCPIQGWDDQCDSNKECQFTLDIFGYATTYKGTCGGLILCTCNPRESSGGAGGSDGGGGAGGSGYY